MKTRQIVLGGVFVAMGIVVPMLFHAIGLGSTFLPMFLPVLMAGLLLDPLPAGLVGFLTPLASAILTGMPPLAPPVAGVMAMEGLALGAVASFLYRRRGWSIWPSAALAVASERCVMGLLMVGLAPVFGLPGKLAVVGTLVKGMSGTILLVGPIPLLVRRLERYRRNQDDS